MKLRKKILTGTLAALIAATSLVGCGSSNQSSITKVGSDGSVSYTLNLGASGDAALNNPLVQLADEKGYFAQNNLTVTSTKLENSGAVMYDALSVGKIDAAYAQVVPPISYGAQGFNVTLIAGVLSGGMVAVCLPDKYEELKDISNWKGHSIGVIQMSTSELTIRDRLKDYGITSDDVNYVMIADYSSIALSAAKGNVDIGFVSSNYVDQAIEAGCVKLTTLYDIKKDYVCCRQSAYTNSLNSNRDAYVYYLEAQIKAYKDIYTDKEGTIASLSKATGETAEYIRTYIYDEEGSAHRTYNPDPNYNGVNGLYTIMLEQKYVTSDLTLDKFYDLSVYADALKNVINENPNDSFYQDMKTYFLENNTEYPNFTTLYGDSFWEGVACH
jgi:NitT/TauT family transport system substrate-binding protein